MPTDDTPPFTTNGGRPRRSWAADAKKRLPEPKPRQARDIFLLLDSPAAIKFLAGHDLRMNQVSDLGEVK
jgi:hypothetical protein